MKEIVAKVKMSIGYPLRQDYSTQVPCEVSKTFL
jgi:hypothetical protein